MSQELVYRTNYPDILLVLFLHQEFAQYGDAAGLGLIHGCDGGNYSIFQQSATHEHLVSSFL